MKAQIDALTVLVFCCCCFFYTISAMQGLHELADASTKHVTYYGKE